MLFLPASIIAPANANAANAGSGYVEDIPLVVIRFNQPRVYFEKQLYIAASEAVKIKQNVIFDVVSFIPRRKTAELNQKISANSSQQAHKVIGSLRKMGISPNNIRVSKEPNRTSRYHELHIYVQ